MNKRVPYTIIPKYLKTINDLDNGAKIKVVYWKLKCEENPSFRGYEIYNFVLYHLIAISLKIFQVWIKCLWSIGS